MPTIMRTKKGWIYLIQNERLSSILQKDIIQGINDGFDGCSINKENIISDIEWLIEQAKKLDKIEQFSKLQI